jgi:polyhydroxyalkanoate synthesis regulator phasin
MDQLAERMDQLAQRMDQLAERMDQLAQRMDELVTAQRETERQIAALVRAVGGLAVDVSGLKTDVATLKGSDRERKYREYAYSFFSVIAERLRTVPRAELADLLDAAVDRGDLTQEEATDVALADVVAHGRTRSDHAEVYLVVEVSVTVAEEDVERAIRRAELLTKAGVTAIPVVAGDELRPDAADRALRSAVWQVTNGRATAPPAA